MGLSNDIRKKSAIIFLYIFTRVCFMKTRLIAAGLHFLASAFVVSLVLSVIYFVWYPAPFYTIHSAFDAVKVLLLVDLVLGPFLTMLIFNVLKPRSELIRDFSIIVVFQLLALGWGIHITYKMRPDFFVFQDNTFYSILKYEVNVEDLNDDVSLPEIWQRPKAIYIEPFDQQEAAQRLQSVIKGERIAGAMYQAERYRPLSLQMDSQYMQDIIHKSTEYTVLLKSKTWKIKVEQFLQDQGGAGEDYLFYSLDNATQFSGIIIFNKKDFSFAGLME